MDKILLLTDVPPCKDFSGALLTYDLATFLPQDSLVCFTLLNPHLNYLKDASIVYPFPIVFHTKPREHSITLSNSILNKIINYPRELFLNKILVPEIIREITKFAREQKVSKIWCILQGQTMIRIALKVANKLNVPLHTQIWDHPIWWLNENKIDSNTRKSILTLFDDTIRKSTMVGTASFEMSKQIGTCQPNNIPLIASLDKSSYKPTTLTQNQNTIRIGVVGQLYASTEWNALLDALGSINWNFNNKNIIIRYLGYSNIAKDRKKMYVEYLGYRSQEETINLMSECDVLYCPYFFDQENEIIAQTSFPSKLTTYLAAGRPVFFHGPSYSSPSLFLKENNAAVFCHSLEKEDIIAVLHDILINSKLARLLVDNGKNALFKHLTMEKLKENFAAFLKIDQNELL